MYATVRRYKNAAALAEAMASRSDEVRKLISGVAGFVGYYASRDGDSTTSMTICNDKSGCDESTKLAGEWVRANVSPLPSAPEISGGEVFLNF